MVVISIKIEVMAKLVDAIERWPKNVLLILKVCAILNKLQFAYIQVILF